MSRRLLPAAIAAWTLVSWGGRIGLLTDADTSDAGSWVRIGGSLVVGTVTPLLMALDRRPRIAAWVFAAWTAAIWTRSSWAVWSEANTLGFRAVHTVLAAVWLVLAVLAVRRFGRREAQAGSGMRSGDDDGSPGGRISASRRTTSSADR